MSAKNKDTIGCIILASIIVAAVIVGGIYERGYYWPASEIVLIPVLAIFIGLRRESWKEGSK